LLEDAAQLLADKSLLDDLANSKAHERMKVSVDAEARNQLREGMGDFGLTSGFQTLVTVQQNCFNVAER